MRLRQIEVFHAVYTNGSMTSAAEFLHVSQPSISKVLAHAEQQLGYALFERSKGKLIPTPEAHRIFEYVSTVYQNVDQLRRVSANLRASDSGCIRIGTTPAFGLELLPNAIASYRESNAKTIFEIETLHHDGLTRALLESQIDIALAFDPVPLPGIATETLATAEFVVLVASSLSVPDNKGLRLSDISHHPFISINNRGPLGRKLTAHIESSNIDLNIVTLTETYHVAKALVACGVGTTIVDEITARSTGASNFRSAPLKPSLKFNVTAMYYDALPLSLMARRFLEHLRETVDEFLNR